MHVIDRSRERAHVRIRTRTPRVWYPRGWLVWARCGSEPDSEVLAYNPVVESSPEILQIPHGRNLDGNAYHIQKKVSFSILVSPFR